MQLYGGRQLATACFGHSVSHLQVVHSLRETFEYNMQKQTKEPKKTIIFFCFLGSFVFLFLSLLLQIVLKLLSQAMYNLMVANTMAETCSCQLPSTIQLIIIIQLCLTTLSTLCILLNMISLVYLLYLKSHETPFQPKVCYC